MSQTSYKPGTLLGRQDLSIFLADSSGQPTDPYQVTFALYFVDPGPPEVEVLVGSSAREPAHPSVGEFYAAILIPTGAQPGVYRIRWAFRQTVGGAEQRVVQEFRVAMDPIRLVQMTPLESQAVMELRTLLRDQCLVGASVVEIRNAQGEEMPITLSLLYEYLGDLQVSGDLD